MRDVSLLRALLIASCTAFLLASQGGPLVAQPHQADRRIATTAGATRVQTGAARAAAPPLPSRRAATVSGWNPARESSDSRDASTWILFSVLVVLLGGVTIRMVHGFDQRPLFDRLDTDDMETQLPG